MREQLKQLLSLRQKQPIVDASRIPAAVLVPVYVKDGQCGVLFTRRTDRVSAHKGQISFPGGAYDEGDKTLLETALRESAEEIGLNRRNVEVLGELDDTCPFTSNYVISPFVALIPWPYQFRLNREETSGILEVPVPALIANGREATEVIDGKVITAYSYHYQNDVIWGATARILRQFLNIYARLRTPIA